MNVLALKIPNELSSASQADSRARGISKSALLRREALEYLLPSPGRSGGCGWALVGAGAGLFIRCTYGCN
jgi:hypothetical protein